MNPEFIRVDPSARVPQRRHGHSCDPDLRIAGALEAGLSPALPGVSELVFATALDAMADNNKAALAADLDCYVDWCAEQHCTAFPAEPETIARYLRARDAGGAKPATLARRVASIARAHAMLGIAERPTTALVVRDTLKAARRRRGADQRQAAPVRFGDALDAETGGFTLSALLAAAAPDRPGLRNAALLSLGYDAGLRVRARGLVEAKAGEAVRFVGIVTSQTMVDEDGDPKRISGSTGSVNNWIIIAPQSLL